MTRKPRISCPVAEGRKGGLWSGRNPCSKKKASSAGWARRSRCVLDIALMGRISSERAGRIGEA